MNLGIFAQTYEGITPATISIVRSKVTAEGDTAAIFALAISADGKAIGTIEIEGAIIQTPAGGKSTAAASPTRQVKPSARAMP